MKRKVLFLLAALLLPAAASAYDACINGIYYNIVKKARQATVTYGESESGTYSGNVNIPATVEYDGVTCNVITIGRDAFSRCTLNSLTIPASISTIEEEAFGNTKINQLHINDLAAWCSVQFGIYYHRGEYNPIAHAEHLYVNGKEVTDLVIPDGVTKINQYAFYRAKMLKTIFIPGSVTEIDYGAFDTNYQGDKFEYDKVTIDNRSLVAIGDNAFGANIKELHITDLAAWCSNVRFYNDLLWENYGADRAYQYNNPLDTSEKFFVNGKEIKDLVIPDGVATITPFAFLGAKMLTSVSMPNSVKEIGTSAFAGCSSITSANIPDKVEEIHCFSGCSRLKELTIGRGVKYMTSVVGHWNGVPSLENLERINISDLKAWCWIYNGYPPSDGGNDSGRNPFARIPKKSPMKASSYTTKARLFLNGTEVKDVVITKDFFEGVASNGTGYDDIYILCDAFAGIASLTSVTIPEDAIPGGIHCKMKSSMDRGFSNCPNLKYIKNESNLEILEVQDCERLETLILGKHTKSCTVYGCKELADVYCAGIPRRASFDSECQVEYATLHVPEILIERYRNTDGWKDFGSIVALKAGDPGYVVPDNTPITFADAAFGAAAIAAFDFNGDGKLSKYEATLVTDFGKAFKENKDIKTIDDLKYFTSMKEINNEAFYGCSSLTSVSFPDFVTTIGERVFKGCGITSVTIPNSIKSIGKYQYWTEANVYINDLAAWCSISFADDANPLNKGGHLYLNGVEVKDLVIPNSVTSIRNYTFSGCSGLTSATIPNSVTSIGKSAFSGCSGLTSVTIPSSVTKIGSDAFYDCDNLKAVYITDLSAWCRIQFMDDFHIYWSDYGSTNPLKYGEHLFLNGKEITNLVIPNSISSIAPIAFYHCSSLTSVTIPNSVTSIGESAFSNCSGLTSVKIPNSVTSIGERAFYGCKGLEKVYSQIEQPFAINEDVFQYYSNGYMFTTATLYVPRGTKALYEATDGWKEFTNIIETDFKDELQGDVNGDMTIDVADIGSVIDVMAGSAGVSPAEADVNGDGVVDVADIGTIIDQMAAQARKQEKK